MLQSLNGPNDSRVSQKVAVLKASIDAVTWEEAVGKIQAWVEEKSSRYVCICNAHSVVTAAQDPGFYKVIEEADMATPDGAPVAWLMRKLGALRQERINGPDLMQRYCFEASARGESIYLYGGSEATLDTLKNELTRRFPGLKIAGAYSPPYRELTPEEQEAAIDSINASEAGTVWVSLGCPKQEAWMAAHRGRVNAVMIGVGAAFDYHAGTIRRAPLWMQHNGLEWLFRLLTEPRRLWKRYLVTNSLFIWHAIRQLLQNRVCQNKRS
ncbi:WecB/TagA/CpsF family glycosyltransferase [Methylophaga sp.]|uniref:WecB/TagA/CpsF family glycosyltransferase n=1 Tax=Methylophaga sp. TaxID=2024840 RepID=UPI003A8CEA25